MILIGLPTQVSWVLDAVNILYTFKTKRSTVYTLIYGRFRNSYSNDELVPKLLLTVKMCSKSRKDNENVI